MNHHFRIVSLLVLLVGLAGAQTPVASSVNLFILSFDNYRSDPEVDWLKEGFVDFLLDYFRTKPGVAAQRTARMEATLDKIDREPELKKGRNYILTGNFQRLNDQFEVNLQLTDITTWKTSEQQKVTVKTSDLAKIIEAVNQAAAGLIDPALRPPDSETAATAARIEREMQSFRETTAATRKITFEVEKLTGLYSEKATLKPGTEKPVVHRNEGVLATEFSRKLSESLSRSATFEEILRRLVDNPYKLEIGDPEFRRVTLNDKMVRMAFGVRFALNRELIDEMLSTLAYDSRTSHDKYTEYQFNGDKFIIQENLLREIALGEFRTYPVVSFINSDGTVAYSLIDVPVVFSRNIKPRSDVKFVAYYQPLFNVTAHVTSVKIQLNNEDREIRYEVELSLEQLSRIDRINVTFLPESGLLEYLNNAD